MLSVALEEWVKKDMSIGETSLSTDRYIHAFKEEFAQVLSILCL